MKRTLAMLVGASLLVSAPLFADEAMSAQTPQQKQMMKDCMTMEKSKNSSMSTDDMKKTCMEKMQSDMQKKPADAPMQGQTPPK